MKQKKYFRNCPKCGKEIGYVQERAFKNACKKQQICISCVLTTDIPLTRVCPQCGDSISYTNRGNRQTAEKQKRICQKCIAQNRDFSGENNPFYGKKHSPETIMQLTVAAKNHIYTETQKEQARIQLAKVTNSRPLYDIWLEKYGKDEADRKLIEIKKKHAKNNSGVSNPMFGKPSPQGSGNGWSGWYKGWYFRSIRELSYMIKVLEANQLEWKTPDNSFKIPYTDYAGQTRTYFPDFIVNNTKLIEIKPVRLHNTPKVLAKKEAAEKFCYDRNMTYELVDPPILNDEEIRQLYVGGQIKFLEKYDQKFKERYLVC